MLGAARVGDAGFPVRAADSVRTQWFLWAWAALAAGERAGRASVGGLPRGLPYAPVPGVFSPRAMVLGTVAMELYVGYAALRERARWFPGAVGDEDWALQHRRGAGRVLDAAAALGGTLIKGSQFASTRPDLLPREYTQTLSSLQDRVPPRPAAEMEEAVSEELGRPIGEVFEEFDPEPIAAASIAQVHRARLSDGREVAVKVRYPGIQKLIEADLAALDAIVEAIGRLEPSVRLGPIVDYLRWTLPLELDLEREGRAMERLREALGDRDDVLVPAAVEGLVTEGLLVMELVEGTKLTDGEALEAAGIEPGDVARLLNDVYADMMFTRGVLHADPHPGNLLVQPGPRLVLLDHGLTVDLEPRFVSGLGGVVAALRDGDLESLIPALGATGLPVDEDTDLDALLRVVGVLLGGENVGPMGLGGFGLRLGGSVGDVPPDLLLVGRAIGMIDGITRGLDPDFDALEVVARYTGAA